MQANQSPIIAIGEKDADKTAVGVATGGMCTFILCCIVALLDGADTQSLAIAAPVITASLSITTTALGVLFSVGLGGAALGALVVGQWADRRGARTMLFTSTLLFGFFQLLSATAWSYESLLLMRFAAGVGLGGAAPCFLSLAAANAPSHRKDIFISVLWACFPLGGLIGGLLNGWLVADYGWRTMFIVGGIVPLALAPIIVFFAREMKPQEQIANISRPAILSALRRDARLRSQTIRSSIIFFIVFGALAALVLWMPTIMVTAGFGVVDGGRILSCHALGATVSMAAAGALIRRWRSRIITTGLFASVLLLIVLATSITNYPAVALSMTTLGITLGVTASGMISKASSAFPENLRSSGLGLSIAVGRFGQILLPTVVGWLIMKTGSPTFAILALAISAMFAGGTSVFSRYNIPYSDRQV